MILSDCGRITSSGVPRTREKATNLASIGPMMLRGSGIQGIGDVAVAAEQSELVLDQTLAIRSSVWGGT